MPPVHPNRHCGPPFSKGTWSKPLPARDGLETMVLEWVKGDNVAMVIYMLMVNVIVVVVVVAVTTVG